METVKKGLGHPTVLSHRIASLADGLRALFRVQEGVDEVGYPECLEPTQANIVTFLFALEEEIHELGRELNWRPWHADKPISKERVLEEFADVLAFLGIVGIHVMRLTDITPDEMAQVYKEISIKNVATLMQKRGLQQ